MEREDGAEWVEWYKDKRLELNAMTTEQFIGWLDRKFEEHGDGKLIPPEGVVSEQVESTVRHYVREEIEERILREARIDEQVEKALEGLDPIDVKGLVADTQAWL